MRLRWIFPIVLGLASVACATDASPTAVPGGTPAPSVAAPGPTAIPGGGPGFALREGPATLGCDTIGLDYTTITWRIDPAAPEPVIALADTGATLTTYWAPGFAAGTAEERVIRDPTGEVIVRDGDTLRVGERLGGYFVCLGPDTAYVLLEDPQ